MKKIISLLLALCMAFCLSACNNQADNQADIRAKEAQLKEDIVGCWDMDGIWVLFFENGECGVLDPTTGDALSATYQVEGDTVTMYFDDGEPATLNSVEIANGELTYKAPNGTKYTLPYVPTERMQEFLDSQG